MGRAHHCSSRGNGCCFSVVGSRWAHFTRKQLTDSSEQQQRPAAVSASSSERGVSLAKYSSGGHSPMQRWSQLGRFLRAEAVRSQLRASTMLAHGCDMAIAVIGPRSTVKSRDEMRYFSKGFSDRDGFAGPSRCYPWHLSPSRDALTFSAWAELGLRNSHSRLHRFELEQR